MTTKKITRAEYQRLYRRRNPDVMNAINRRYRQNHLSQARLWEKVCRWKKLGLPEPTRPMPEHCEICGRPPSRGQALRLDHDHVTGAFRGWLCATCNLALGLLNDSVSGVTAALTYLTRSA